MPSITSQCISKDWGNWKLQVFGKTVRDRQITVFLKPLSM